MVRTPANTPAAYQPPSEGPFSCDHCEYYRDPGQCRKPQVIQELGGTSMASVQAKGCCNFYERTHANSAASWGLKR